jgi:hypothetical protein
VLHAASSRGVRLLRLTDIDPAARTIGLGQRPHPVPLDAASWSIRQRCLAHRRSVRTDNPYVMVTRGTEPAGAPRQWPPSATCSTLRHPPWMLRGTRLVDLVNTMEPRLVAVAFGMDPEG